MDSLEIFRGRVVDYLSECGHLTRPTAEWFTSCPNVINMISIGQCAGNLPSRVAMAIITGVFKEHVEGLHREIQLKEQHAQHSRLDTRSKT